MAGQFYSVAEGLNNAPVYQPIPPPPELRSGPRFTWTIESRVWLRVFGDRDDSDPDLVQVRGEIELFWQHQKIRIALPEDWVPLAEFRTLLCRAVTLRYFVCRRDRRRYSWTQLFCQLWQRGKVEMRERWGSLPEDCRTLPCPSPERLRRHFCREEYRLGELAEGLHLCEVEARVVPPVPDSVMSTPEMAEDEAAVPLEEAEIVTEAVRLLNQSGLLKEPDQRDFVGKQFQEDPRFSAALNPYTRGIKDDLWRKIHGSPELGKQRRGRPRR